MKVEIVNLLAYKQHQAYCTLVIFQQFVIMLDCGISLSLNIEPYLKNSHIIKRVTLILITHASLQHSGALPLIIEELKISPVVLSTPIILNLAPYYIHQAFMRNRFYLYNGQVFGKVSDVFRKGEFIKPGQYKQIEEVKVSCYQNGNTLGSIYWKISYGVSNVVYMVGHNLHQQKHINPLNISPLHKNHIDILITDNIYPVQAPLLKIGIQKYLQGTRPQQTIHLLVYPHQRILQVYLELKEIRSQFTQKVMVFMPESQFKLIQKYKEFMKDTIMEDNKLLEGMRLNTHADDNIYKIIISDGRLYKWKQGDIILKITSIQSKSMEKCCYGLKNIFLKREKSQIQVEQSKIQLQEDQIGKTPQQILIEVQNFPHFICRKKNKINMTDYGEEIPDQIFQDQRVVRIKGKKYCPKLQKRKQKASLTQIDFQKTIDIPYITEQFTKWGLTTQQNLYFLYKYINAKNTLIIPFDKRQVDLFCEVLQVEMPIMPKGKLIQVQGQLMNQDNRLMLKINKQKGLLREFRIKEWNQYIKKQMKLNNVFLRYRKNKLTVQGEYGYNFYKLKSLLYNFLQK